MKFNEYLNYLQINRKCSSVAELFKLLGSNDRLGMSLRNFNLLCSGQQLPSIVAFNSIFNSLNPDEYKRAIECFFESHNNENSKLVKFLKSNMNNELAKPKDSVWKTSNEIYFSLDQIQYLAKNARAIRLHHRLLVEDKIKISLLKKDKKILDDLVSIGLATINGDYISYPRPYLRLPSYKNSAPSEVGESNRLITETLKTFLSYEGDDTQTINYVCANLNIDSANKIHEELLRIKEKCLALAENSDPDNNVPFLLITFGKNLTKKDFL